MATTSEKTTPCCSPQINNAAATSSSVPQPKQSSVATFISSVPDPPPKTASSKEVKDRKETISFDIGNTLMARAQTSHPLDPLSVAEISVAVATVRAAGKTPEVRDSMRFVEVSLVEPEKQVVALADAYFFPPFQPSLLPRTKKGPVIPTKLPPRKARLVVYNKKSNETSIWIVELTEVHAATRGGHHRGKMISSTVVPDIQPPMDAVEYAECEAVIKDFPPFREAMKKRGIEDMDLVMVDTWCAGYHSGADTPSRRLAKPLFFCRTESDCPMENGYARPVEGIHMLVDMQNMVIYSIAYVDGNRGRRPVAHRLSFVEMVVPYGDPNDPHYRKNAHSLKKVKGNTTVYLLYAHARICSIIRKSAIGDRLSENNGTHMNNLNLAPQSNKDLYVNEAWLDFPPAWLKSQLVQCFLRNLECK